MEALSTLSKEEESQEGSDGWQSSAVLSTGLYTSKWSMTSLPTASSELLKDSFVEIEGQRD